MTIEQAIEKEIAKIEDTTDLVTYELCHCGFGEPRGNQCECPYERHHIGYIARQYLRSAFKRVAEAAQSPLMFKELQEKTRKDALEEAARVCEEKLFMSRPLAQGGLSQSALDYNMGIRAAIAAIRALSTHDTV